MKLVIPPEPIKTKEDIIKPMEESLGNLSRSEVNLIMWSSSGNRNISKYLWDSWKEQLTEYGYKYQKFLKLLRDFERDLYKWAIGELSWNNLVEKIIHKIERKILKDSS